MGALLQDALNERISIREGDVIRKVSRAEAAVLALLSKAMKGDAKAFSTLLAFAQQSGEFEKEPQPMEYFRRIIIRPEDFGVFPGGKRCPPEELTTTVLQDQESVQQPKSNSRK